MSEITLLVKARNEASAVLQQVKGDLQSLGSTAESMKATLQSAGASVRNVGLGLSAGVTAPVAAIGATGLHAAADFETAMNTIAVVTGATGDTINQMRTIALQLGIETSFSATEAASAMLELGKAGMSTEQVMNAISGTLDLAAAAGMTVADAATVSANAINAFGLDASQAGVVADMFAAAANSSSIEMHDMAMSMKMSGAVFAANKVPIEDLSTAIAILGNSGLIGSDAGTALKTMLMRLTAPTDDAAEAMRSLGLQVYNADGTMRAFPDILAQMEQALYGVNQVTVSSSNLTGEQADRMEYLGGRIASTQRKIADYQSGIEGANLSDEARAKAIAELNASLSAQQAEYQQLAAVGSVTSTVFRQLTDEQRQNYLTTIFGADAIRAASILTQEGAAAYAEMKESVTEAGAATLVADARMKGLGGALLYLKGTIESTLITAVSPFLPALAQMARQAADMVAAFTKLPEGLRNAVVVFAAVAAAVGPLLVVLGMLTSAVGAALPVLAAIGGALGALASPIGLLIAAVVGLGAAWATNFGGIRDATMPVVDAVVGAFSRIGAALSVFGASASWSALKATVVSAVQAIGGALDGLFSGRLSIPNFVGQLQQQFSRVRGAVSGLLSGADFGALGDSILAALGLKDVDFSAVSAALQQFVANVVGGIASFDWGGALAEIGGSINGFTSSIANAMAAVDWGGALGAAGDWLNGFTSSIANAMAAIDWGGAFASAGNWLGGFTSSIANAMAAIDWGGTLATAGNWLNGFTNSIANAMGSIDWGGAFASAGGAATALRDGVFNSLSASIAGIDWSGLGMNVTGFVDSIAAAIRGIDWSSIKAETAFAALVPHAAAAIAGLRWVFTSDSFAGLLSSVTGAISSIDWGGISASFTNLGASVVSAIQSLDWSNVQNAFDGLRLSVISAVASIDWGGPVTAIGDGATDLRDGVFGWLTNAIASIDFRSASLNFASLIDSVAASIASIDWSSIQAEHLFAALVAPVTAAIAGLTWLFGSDSFAGLTSAVGSTLASIDWGSIGASFGGLTTAVANAMAGLDWSTVTNGIQAAQTSAQQAADGFDFFGAVGGAVGGIGQTMNDLRDSILAGLTDALASLDLTGAFTGLLDAMTSQITSIDWSTVGSSLAASLTAALSGIQWVFSPSTWAGLGSAVSSALSSALNPETLKGAAVAAFATLAPTVAAALAGVAWVVSSDNFAGLGTAARNAIANLDWSAVGASFDKLKASVVNALGDFVSGFGAGFTWQWPEWEWPVWKWPALPEWKWPEWTWPELPKFSWPAFPSFSWPSFPSFSWPAFPSFSWPAMPSWWPFGGEAANNQLGASYFGGGWTWVGEAGRELVRLPRGTEILPNRRAEQLAAAGGGVNLTIEQMIVREEADIYALAYQVAAVLTRG